MGLTIEDSCFIGAVTALARYFVANCFRIVFTVLIANLALMITSPNQMGYSPIKHLASYLQILKERS